MGCWNHTCAVTNLPIFAGDEVEVILLKSAMSPSDYASFCHLGSYYTPLPLTFHGTYNDYGAVEDCEGVALDTLINRLREVLVEFDVGENQYHDIEVKKEDFDVDYLFTIDHESRFYIDNGIRMFDSPKTLRVKHIVVRKEVYDAIVEKTVIDWWCGPSKHKLSNLDTEQFAKDIDEFHNLDANDVKQMMMRFRGVGETITKEILKNEGGGVYGMNQPINILETLMDVRLNQPEIFDGLLDNALRFVMFNHFMEAARKSYVVPSGVGSQDDSTKSQELCARLTLSSAKAQRKRWKEEYEE